MKNLIILVNQTLSKVLFGSYIGLDKFLIGYTKILYHGKKRLRFQKSSGLEQLLSQGYVKFDSPIDEVKLNSCYSEIKEKLDDQNNVIKLSNTDKFKGEGFKKLLKNPDKINGIYDLIPQHVFDILVEFYGTEKFHIIPEVWRNFHVPNQIIKDNEILSDRFHLDANDYSLLKLFILVHQVDNTLGPYTFIDKKNSKKFIRSREYISRNNYKEEVLDQCAIKVTGDAGMYVLGHNAFCLHKAGIPSEGKFRDIIQFKFYL